MPPENTEIDNERVGNKIKAEIKEIKDTQIAILKGIREIEKELGEPCMPKGTYHGIGFED